MVPERGGVSMQERVRYYITKSGEEPTVRSVKVARSSPQSDDLDASAPSEPGSSHDVNPGPGDSRGARRKWRGSRAPKQVSGDA